MAAGSSQPVFCSIPFKLEKLIAIGSQGLVYRAVRTDVKASKPVAERNIAVKKITLALDEHDRKTQADSLHLQLSKFLPFQHPNIVRHLDLGQLPGELPHLDVPAYYVLMEYYSGGTVQDAVATTWLSPANFQRWTKQILEGLQYLHSANVVHRDIKGDNVVLSIPDMDNCQLKIIDLGEVKRLLKDVTQQKEVSHSKGTTYFMSPEMIQAYSKDINIGRKTDIWSLGCVLIQMITGKPPTFSKTLANGTKIPLSGEVPVMNFVFAGGSPDIPAGLPPVLDSFMRSCLCYKESDRLTATELLSHELIVGNANTWTYPMFGRTPISSCVCQNQVDPCQPTVIDSRAP